MSSKDENSDPMETRLLRQRIIAFLDFDPEAVELIQSMSYREIIGATKAAFAEMKKSLNRETN